MIYTCFFILGWEKSDHDHKCLAHTGKINHIVLTSDKITASSEWDTEHDCVFSGVEGL